MCNKDHLTNSQLLKVYEQRSTCARLQVAAVIVRDGRVIASGWNGAPSGQIHCTHHFKDKSADHFQKSHHEFSLNNEVHAEANALGFAAKHGIATHGAELYCTFSPCLSCAKQIQASGITSVYYETEYDRDPAGVKFLNQCNIPTIRLSSILSKK